MIFSSKVRILFLVYYFIHFGIFMRKEATVLPPVKLFMCKKY